MTRETINAVSAIPRQKTHVNRTRAASKRAARTHNRLKYLSGLRKGNAMWTFWKPTVAMLAALLAGCIFSKTDKTSVVATDRISAAQGVEAAQSNAAMGVDDVETAAADVAHEDNSTLPLFRSELPPVTNVVIDNSLRIDEEWSANVQPSSDCNGKRLDEAKVRQFFSKNFEVPEQFYWMVLRHSRCKGKATLTLADGRSAYATIDLITMKALVTYSTTNGLIATEFYFCPTCGWSSVQASDLE